jgi:hypothetical protein
MSQKLYNLVCQIVEDSNPYEDKRSLSVYAKEDQISELYLAAIDKGITDYEDLKGLNKTLWHRGKIVRKPYIDLSQVPPELPPLSETCAMMIKESEQRLSKLVKLPNQAN